MSRQHILSRLGEHGWAITYSNGVPFTWDFLKHLQQNGCSRTTEKKDNVRHYIPGICIPRSLRFNFLDNYSIDRHCRELKKISGIGAHDDFMVICFDPDFDPFIEKLNPTFTTLHIYDLYDKIGYNSEKFRIQLKNVLTRANLITASSQYQLESIAKGYEHKGHVVHNSGDYESISSAEDSFTKPEVLRNIRSPRIGYLGAINRKIDFGPLLSVAKKNSAWQFVFIGPVNEKEIATSPQHRAYKEFKHLSNVHFVGEVGRHQIPDFLQSMDVNLMCFRDGVDCWSKHAYPLKLNEYLATGAPVVSSILPVVQQECGDLVYFADSPEEWEQKLGASISERAPSLASSRKAFAKENSWDHRVEKYEGLILDVINQ